MFGFVRKHHPIQSGCTVLRSHRQWSEFLLLQVLTSIWCRQCLDLGDCDGCVVVSSCYFNLQFPDDIRCWTPFHALFAIYVSPLIMYLARYLAHVLITWFVFLSLGLKNSLYILDKSPSLNMAFANIFSQSMASNSLKVVFHRAEF